MHLQYEWINKTEISDIDNKRKGRNKKENEKKEISGFWIEKSKSLMS